MNFATLLPIILKYLPAVIDFIQKEGPAVKAFVDDIKAHVDAANAAPVPTGAVAPAQLGPLLQQLLGHLQSGKLNLPGGFTS